MGGLTRLAILVALALGPGCSGKRRAPAEDRAVPAPAEADPAPPAKTPAKTPAKPLAGGGPEILHPTDGPVAPQALAAAEKARAAGKTLLVYVGASWCEPCVAFHRAVESGELDTVFPDLQVLEFDQDRDGKRLSEAGYVSRLIPLFAVPDEQGKMGTHISGGIKGRRAVDNLVERLQPLIAAAR